MVKVEFIFTSLKSDKPVQGGGKCWSCGRGEIHGAGYACC